MKANEFFKDDRPEYVAIFSEMAARIGKTLDELELKKSDCASGHKAYGWPYDAHEWTEEEEDDFRKWLIEYVYKNRRVFGLSYATKKMISERTVPMFMLQYGWRHK